MENNADLQSLKERYEIIDELGRGGMSIVYKARDKTLDRLVALKTLSVRSLSEKQLVQFQAEARALSGLKHKGIMEILDFGITKSGKPYMVLEFIEGVPLSNHIENLGPLPSILCLSIFVDLCDALNHAHNKGVLHRDVKPSNIILVSSGKDSYTPKIIDFGLAVIHHNLYSTGETSMAGSPPYMSPEQIEGKELDQRSDIYSLGCTLFEALTGKLPFHGQNALETMNMHKTAPVPGLSKVSEEIEIQNSLQTFINKSLAKNKNDRHQYMIAVQKSLDEILTQAKELAAKRKRKISDLADDTDLNKKKKGFNIWILSSISAIAALCFVFNLVYNEYTKHSKKEEEVQTKAMKHDNARGAQGTAQLQEFVHRKDGTEKLTTEMLLNLPLSTTDISKGTGTIIEADFSVLKRLPKLERIRMGSCNLKEEHVKQLSTLNQLKRLEILNNELFEADLTCVANLKNLIKFQGEACHLNKKSMLSISKMKTLEEINLEIENGLDKEIIQNLTQLPNLKEIQVGGNADMTEEDKKTLGKFKNLELLGLDSLLIDDKMAEYLAANLTGVKRLSVTHNLITIKGLKSLLKIPGIKWINMNACEKLTDDDSADAIEILNKTLKHIEIVDESRFTKKEERE